MSDGGLVAGIFTDVMGIGIIIVLLRMNHTLGKLSQGLIHFGRTVEDHETRLRAVEIRPTSVHMHRETTVVEDA